MKLVAIAVLPLSSLLLAGCGAGSSGDALSESEAATALERAADKTMRAGTAKLTLKASILANNESTNFEGSGVSDFAGGRSRMTLDMSDLARSAPEQFTGAPEDWEGEVIYDGDFVYIRLPALSKMPGGVAGWIRFDAGAASRAGSPLFSAPDPDELLRFVEAAGPVEVAGSESLRGVETTHVRSEIKVEDLARLGSSSRDPGIKVYAKRLQDAGLRTIALDTWLDEEGRIRRLSAAYEDLSNSGASGGPTADLSYSLDLFDFGTTKPVRLPPASRVTDFGPGSSQ